MLVLTTFDLDDYVYDALRAGASGFLLKDVRGGQLSDAIRVVAAGEALLAPSITRRLIEQFVARQPPHRPAPAPGALTEREVEVLRLLAAGLSNAEIAEHARDRHHGEDARRPAAHQTRAARPRPGRRLRVRIGIRAAPRVGGQEFEPAVATDGAGEDRELRGDAAGASPAHERSGGMYARSTTVRGKPAALEDGIAYVRDKVMPASSR